MLRFTLAASLLILGWLPDAFAGPPAPTLEPLVRTVDVRLGQAQEVQLADGKKATVKLLELKETRDPIRDAIREARAHVEVNGERIWLTSANYELPRTVAGVQIDCPITKGYLTNSSSEAWGLAADARLRLWPAGSPLVKPGTMVYPVKQRWFASSTQMANEPCYVDAGERPQNRKIYYHYGLDFGGCEGMIEVVAATDGLVVSARTDRLPGYDDTPVKPRYDVIYVLDARGWYYRYSHLFSIDDSIRPGVKVRAGQRLGLLGKEGGSGGWSHLHFDIFCRQPSGKWGCLEAYAFAWEAYQRQYQPKLIAVARPHHLAWAGDRVTLDAGRSWSADGKIVRYDWTFTDGAKAEGVRVDRVYDRPGYYSEVLKITDAAGCIDYDFAIVHIHDRKHPEQFPPSIHVVYAPTFDLKPGDEVTFKARTFATTDGEETWDFGDGTPKATTRSDGNVRALAKDGYAVITHRYARPGHYLVRVERTDRLGHRAVGHVQVRIGEDVAQPPSAVRGSQAQPRAAVPQVGSGIGTKAIDADVLLKGGTIYDGGEGDGVVGDVALRGSQIVAVGKFKAGKVGRSIDCAGLVVAPGFLDAHTHSDATVLDAKVRPCLNYLLQGCTTMVTGNCGGGPGEVATFLDKVDRQGVGANIVHLVPHGTVRRTVMGDARREPTLAELDRMKSLVAQGMREGAWGMSTGLIYPPSCYAKTEELVELSKVVAEHGGIYVSHIRGEGSALLKSVGEAIEIGRRAGVPVQISHFKALGVPNWGRIRDAAAMIDKARHDGVRVTADQYPYAASSPGLESTVLPDDAIPGGRRNLAKRMAQDPELAKSIRNLVQRQLKSSKKIVIAACRKHPEYAGKSLQQIADEQKADPADVALRIALEGSTQVVNFGMSEEDVRWAMSLPWVATGSDGNASIPRPGAFPHPRSFGTMARKIGFCAIEQKWISLGHAVRSCSGLPADIFGLAGRGYLRPGYVADVVVFDPKTFRDRATFEKPQLYATGVHYVFLAGRPAIDAGKPTNALLGRAIRHPSK